MAPMIIHAIISQLLLFLYSASFPLHNKKYDCKISKERSKKKHILKHLIGNFSPKQKVNFLSLFFFLFTETFK